ncbi:MAG: hypothetical protein V1775_03225 [Bacteroidota bacterium]
MAEPAKESGRLIRLFFLYLSLLIIPATLFITSLDTIRVREKVWYDAGYDPEYAYLFNSLNMARFRLAGHIDHPGTPMQMAGGMVLQGAWMFDHRDESLTNAVIAEPEHYVRLLNTATAIAGSLALFIVALLLFRKVQNIWYSFILQLTPFISGFVLFNGFTRVTQEMMLMAASLALAAVSLYCFFKLEGENNKRFIILFGIVSGFGMASKILFAPLLIIPLILLETVKAKKRYIIIAMISFVVFTLPVIRLYPNIAYWIFRLFIHTGRYGSGDIGIIDTSGYLGNLSDLFRISPVLSVIFFGSVFVFFTDVFLKIFNKRRPDPAALRLLLAVTVAQAAGFLLVAKQPKEAYLLPYECLAAVNVIIIFHILISSIQGKVLRMALSGVFTLLIAIAVVPYGLARKSEIYSADKNSAWEHAWLAATSNPGKEAVIFAHPGSSPVAGLYFGNVYSLRRYDRDLQRAFPDYYIFDGVTKEIYHWEKMPISLESIFMKYQGRIRYIGPNDKPFPEFSQQKISGWIMQSIWKDEKQVIMTPVKIGNQGMTTHGGLIFCPAEVSSEKDENIRFPGVSDFGILNFVKSFSGRSSILTNSENSCAFSLEPVKGAQGGRIEVSVRASGNQDDLVIEAKFVDSDQTIAVSENEHGITKNEWYLLKLNIDITEEMAGREIRVSVWNKGSNKAWFDDFRMELLNPYSSYNTDNELDIGE